MIQHFVYLIQSEKDGSYYIGQTNNLEKRLIRHNQGRVISTKNKAPWNLIKFKAFPNRSEAMWYEHLVKTRKIERHKFIGV